MFSELVFKTKAHIFASFKINIYLVLVGLFQFYTDITNILTNMEGVTVTDRRDNDVVTTDSNKLDNFPEDTMYGDMDSKLLALPQIVEDLQQTTYEKNKTQYLLKLKPFVSPSVVHIPITTIIRTGVVSTLVDILRTGNRENKCIAAHIIGNLLSGNTNQIKYIVDLGIIDIYIDILNTMECNELVSKTLTGFYNIFNDSYETRLLLLEHDIKKILINSRSKTKDRFLIEKFDWFRECTHN